MHRRVSFAAYYSIHIYDRLRKPGMIDLKIAITMLNHCMTFELAAVQIWTWSPALFFRYCVFFYALALEILDSRKSRLITLLGAWTMFHILFVCAHALCIARNVWLRNCQLIAITHHWYAISNQVWRDMRSLTIMQSTQENYSIQVDICGLPYWLLKWVLHCLMTAFLLHRLSKYSIKENHGTYFVALHGHNVIILTAFAIRKAVQFRDG